MKQIPLSRGKFALVDDEDYDRLSQFKWCLSSKGYAMRTGDRNKSILMHREIMGVLSESRHVFVDHINHDTLNNCRSNLRICNHAQNQMNKDKKKNSTSRYKGVYWVKRSGLWRAGICKDNIRRRLGYFKSEEDAARAYNAEALRLFGEYAKINDL